jgi:hypothetical protein
MNFHVLILLKTSADATNNCILLQVPEGYSGEDVEAHGCIHMGGFAPH